MKKNLPVTLLISLLLPVMAGCSPTKDLTRSNVRVVWVQDMGDGSDTAARGEKLRLMGLDSQKGGRERVILKDVRNYFKPMITPDGEQVVFSDIRQKKVYIVDWSGKNKRQLCHGVALEVWKDPVTERGWVYFLDGPDKDKSKHSTNPLWRTPLDDPEQRELVWKKTHLTWDNIQLSHDGKKASGLFPWPHGGILDVERGKYEKLGRGCWTSFSPDNSYLLWIFDGQHRNVSMFSHDGKRRWKVNINQAEGVDGYEVYHPRWSNHPRYLVMTGPYKEGEGGNRIRGGGDRVEIYAGRFNEDLTEVEKWVQITDNKRGDFFPDFWVDESYDTTPPGAPVAEPVEAEAASEIAQVVVQATCTEAYSLADPTSLGLYDRALAVHTYKVNEVESGDVDGKTIYVAQWLVEDKKLVQPEVKPGQKKRLVLEDFYDHPELEGERLFMGPGIDLEADIFMDVSQLRPE